MQRGQGSMEYLMTYGWAILVVVLVGFLLWQSGVFGVSTNSVSGFQKISVEEFVYNTGGSLHVAYRNTAGSTLNNVQVNYSGDVNGVGEYTGNTNWAAGKTYLDHTSDACSEEGAGYIINIAISWVAGSGISHSDHGTIRGQCERGNASSGSSGSSGSSSSWVVNTSSLFNEGSYTQTTFNTTHVELSIGQSSGNYTSKVFNATEDVSWDNISWVQGGYYQQELPHNKAIETGFSGVNMTGNILLLHLNESSGDFTDYSGEGLTATAENFEGDEYGTTGKFGDCLDFDGTDDYVNTTVNQNLSGGSFSLFVWVKDISGNYVISQAHTMTPTYSSDWILGYSSGGLWFRSQIIGGGGTISDGDWHHLGFTFDETTARLYIDANLIGSVIPSGYGASSGATVNLMTRGDGTSSFVSGKMDEVAIWNRTLSPTEILDNYKRGALKLNLAVRSCDDAVCDTENFSAITGNSPQSLSLTNNQWFQFKYDFETDNSSYSPKLYNITTQYST